MNYVFQVKKEQKKYNNCFRIYMILIWSDMYFYTESNIYTKKVGERERLLCFL